MLRTSYLTLLLSAIAVIVAVWAAIKAQTIKQ
jgi:hypothetical protein